MHDTLRAVLAAANEAREHLALVQARSAGIRASVGTVTHTIRELNARTLEIGDMIGAVQAAVTTMGGGMHSLAEGLQLAAAAASDKREIQEIHSRLFAKIDEQAVAAHANGERAETMAQSADLVGGAIVDASRSAQMTSVSVQPLHRLMGRFKVAG